MSACATIINDKTISVPINTKPSGANIAIIDYATAPSLPPVINILTKTSPTVLKLKRGYSYEIIVSKEGYYPVREVLEQSIEWTYWLNIPFIWGLIVDIANKRAIGLQPKHVLINLKRKTGN